MSAQRNQRQEPQGTNLPFLYSSTPPAPTA